MSPIRPENAGRYPDDWKDITASIRERARDRCECRGECGHEHRWRGNRCNAPNRTRIRRARQDPATWVYETDMDWAGTAWFPAGHYLPPVDVVLTVAHLDHMPEHNEPENLRALCQFCHNHYDATHRAQTRRRTEEERSGQTTLFE